LVDEEIPLEAPVPTGTVIVEEEEISLLVLLTGTTDETPVPIGAVGPAEAVLLVPLP
jgi:hypothetical protein